MNFKGSISLFERDKITSCTMDVYNRHGLCLVQSKGSGQVRLGKVNMMMHEHKQNHIDLIKLRFEHIIDAYMQ